MKVLSVSLIPGPYPEGRREITELLAATFTLTFMMRIATPRKMKKTLIVAARAEVHRRFYPSPFPVFHANGHDFVSPPPNDETAPLFVFDPAMPAMGGGRILNRCRQRKGPLVHRGKKGVFHANFHGV